MADVGTILQQGFSASMRAATMTRLVPPRLVHLLIPILPTGNLNAATGDQRQGSGGYVRSLLRMQIAKDGHRTFVDFPDGSPPS